MRGGLHRSIRSHCMASDATPGPPSTLLPISLDKLRSITDDQIATIRRLHAVRGDVVQALLQFYKAHNYIYSGVQVETGNHLDTHVADSVIDFTTSVPSSVVEAVDDDQARVGAENDLELENEIPSSNREPVTELPTANKSADRRFLIRNSSKFACDSDGSIYAKMFPHLFPYGRGHPGEERLVPVSYDGCIKYYTMHSSRRFAEDDTFLLVTFDRLSTQKMSTWISLTCKRYPDMFSD
ncbi:hypothetical protein PHPALM_29316 [Phytophthora palmivora]|uniref:Uncharacterized protein n=1 Tax=Phytophthora palmivora TaxID=4796 RepID=A0A2P4X7W4_9STRA|nr:hypothetical protein PHPALM_29316 [Phytophthora palmivora]